MTWRKIKLGEIVENFSVRAKDIDDDYSEFPFLGVSNETGITLSKYAAEDKAEDYKIIEKGCFAYNPYRVNVGSIGLLNQDSKGLISPAYVIFKTKPETIIDELLLKFLKSSEGLRQIKLHARGTVRQALRFDDLCKIELSIPDYEYQETIFNRLNFHQISGDKISTELSHQLELVSGLRQAFLREAMQGKLVPQDERDEPAEILLEKIKAEKEKLIAEKKIKKQKPLSEIKPEEIPFEIPNNWTWCRLGEIAELKSGNQYSYEKSNSGVMYVKVGDMNIDGNEYEILESSTYFEEKSIKQNDLIPVKSIIFPKRGGAIATNKRRAILKEPILVDSNTMSVIPSSEIDFDFFLWWFNTIDLAEFGNVNIIPQVNNKDLVPLSFPLPPLAEQKRIVEKLEKLMKFCDELEANILESKTQAENLLQIALKEALEPKEELKLTA